MICQATYDSQELIPEAFRGDFELKNGKWVLKSDAIPGAAELLNPGLAANRDDILGQLSTAKQKITATQLALNEAQSKTNIPEGSVVLNKEDAKAFEKYTSLGTVKEVEAKVSAHAELSSKMAVIESNAEIAKVAQAANINASVLQSWKNDPVEGQGISKFYMKNVQQTDPKGQIITVAVPYVERMVNENGTMVARESPLVQEAQSVLPDWKFTALVNSGTAATGGNQSNSGQAAPANTGVQPVIPQQGLYIPNIAGSAARQQSQSQEAVKPAAKFQSERDKVPSPFAKQTS